MAGTSEAETARQFAAAHRALVEDGAIQFDLPRVVPDPPPPAWLKAIGEWLERVFAPVGRALRWIGAQMPDAPFARIFLWTMLALAAAALVWMLWQRGLGRGWRLPWRRGPRVEGGQSWQPDPVPARRWLDEADALAADGRFAEAAHHLLMRSVEDIATRRPQLVRPAMTSRDLSRAQAIPAPARQFFAAMATVVERSLFGGRPVEAEAWRACRADYTAFAGGGAWAG